MPGLASSAAAGWALLVCVPSCTPSEVAQIQAIEDESGRQFLLAEAGQPVLRYHYYPVEPGQVLTRVSENNLKYARSRSDYIHPLYGLDGEELTLDWPVDHPHHRGIYWAWPEVQFGSELGDLHALQRVFARPTGKYRLASSDDFAEIEAESAWHWESGEPIVRELAWIRAYRRNETGRLIDLEFHFTALKDGVTLARRNQNQYGGLNIRLAKVEGQQILFYTDPSGTDPPRAWSELSGVFRGSGTSTGISVFQHPDNPHYPGDWFEVPELNWFQPTFPAAGDRYPLAVGKTLTLRFRIWIHAGQASGEEHARRWETYRQTPSLGTAEGP